MALALARLNQHCSKGQALETCITMPHCLIKSYQVATSNYCQHYYVNTMRHALILINEISFHCNVGPKQPISIIVKPFGIFWWSNLLCKDGIFHSPHPCSSITDLILLCLLSMFFSNTVPILDIFNVSKFSVILWPIYVSCTTDAQKLKRCSLACRVNLLLIEIFGPQNLDHCRSSTDASMATITGIQADTRNLPPAVTSYQ